MIEHLKYHSELNLTAFPPFILWQIMHGTNGQGVNMVLNSLAEEKLQASLRCLARHGRFLEIGKYDLSNNTPLGMALFLRNVSFHGILLDAIFEENNPEWGEVSELLIAGIKSGMKKYDFVYTIKIIRVYKYKMKVILGSYEVN